jgi:hypothetical protein
MEDLHIDIEKPNDIGLFFITPTPYKLMLIGYLDIQSHRQAREGTHHYTHMLTVILGGTFKISETEINVASIDSSLILPSVE